MILTAATRMAETLLRAKARLGGQQKLRDRLVMDDLPPRADIWIHAASVGEVNSAALLIDRLAERHRILVTTNSETGLARARSKGWPAALAPLDMPGALTRFLDAALPRVAVTVEGEIWPLRARMLAARGIAHVIVGARMSERSARRWSRAPRLIAPVLQNVAAVSAQDGESERRLLDLGLPQGALRQRLDLKLLAPAQVTPPRPSAARDMTLLAASTHPGEDEQLIDAFLAARATCPGLRLILAPRHPDRADQIAATITSRGISFDRRSQGQHSQAALLLADTLGEMDLWYDQAGLCLTGGSLVDHGGHTPWEPAAHGCAILHGPHLSNFAESYATLDQAGAARMVRSGDLAPTITALLAQPETARDMGRKAREVLDQRAGDPAELLALIGDLAKTDADGDITD